jgi:hypothetical protein
MSGAVMIAAMARRGYGIYLRVTGTLLDALLVALGAPSPRSGGSCRDGPRPRLAILSATTLCAD